ncbi:hypothetical protein HK100_004112 [Physocladia obscura]|uniref:Uncharacterized protein n=1 Tax=Physocladia obscura TaxID=109957 RepID=A0AAD5STH9_9FUNG|nr:hypothetical protein HK100_004112 [Physocladia obscura]
METIEHLSEKTMQEQSKEQSNIITAIVTLPDNRSLVTHANLTDSVTDLISLIKGQVYLEENTILVTKNGKQVSAAERVCNLHGFDSEGRLEVSINRAKSFREVKETTAKADQQALYYTDLKIISQFEDIRITTESPTKDTQVSGIYDSTQTLTTKDSDLVPPDTNDIFKQAIEIEYCSNRNSMYSEIVSASRLNILRNSAVEAESNRASLRPSTSSRRNIKRHVSLELGDANSTFGENIQNMRSRKKSITEFRKMDQISTAEQNWQLEDYSSGGKFLPSILLVENDLRIEKLNDNNNDSQQKDAPLSEECDTHDLVIENKTADQGNICQTLIRGKFFWYHKESVAGKTDGSEQETQQDLAENRKSQSEPEFDIEKASKILNTDSRSCAEVLSTEKIQVSGLSTSKWNSEESDVESPKRRRNFFKGLNFGKFSHSANSVLSKIGSDQSGDESGAERLGVPKFSKKKNLASSSHENKNGMEKYGKESEFLGKGANATVTLVRLCCQIISNSRFMSFRLASIAAL